MEIKGKILLKDKIKHSNLSFTEHNNLSGKTVPYFKYSKDNKYCLIYVNDKVINIDSRDISKKICNFWVR